MRKLSEVPPAWESDTESFNSPDEWDKGKLLVKLKNEGHTAIAVDRAVLVIEQCDPDDDVPKGWSQDPLKVSIYADPDLAGDAIPEELYIHAGRHGLMHVFLETKGKQAQTAQNKIHRLVPVEATAMSNLEAIGDVARAQTILHLMKWYLSGHYFSTNSPNAISPDAATPVADETLARLKKEAEDAIQKYIDHLNTRPDLHPGWPNPVLD